MNFDQQLSMALRRRGMTDAQLAEVDETARSRGQRMMDAVLHLRYLPEADLSQIVAELLGMRFRPRLDVEEMEVELTLNLRVTFCKDQLILPMRRRERHIEVAIADPFNLEPLDSIQLFLGAPVEPVVVPEQELLDAINKVFDRRAAAIDVLDEMDEEKVVNVDGGIDELEFDIIDTDDEAPIIRLVNAIMAQAVKERASDIHIEPFERYLAVRFRVDGVLNEIAQPSKRLHAAVSSRIKVMAGLDIAEKRIPQDGRIKLKVAGRDIDIRLSTLPTSFGERLVMRLLDKTAVLKDLSHIGMGAWVLEQVNDIITKPHGILLVTGPTGSGKTTTLYACLAKINSPVRNIITVEDPVEYQLPGIGQTQVNAKVGLTFAAGLRSILRQDPDVVMVGEIRDKETAEIAIQASLTGHMVFSTLHTNDAAGAVTRLVDMGVEPFLVASSVVGIMAQRLVRTLCKDCRQQVVPLESELSQVGYTRERFLSETNGYVYQAVGCQECRDTGYRGRTGIYELLVVDDDIRPLIMENRDSGTIKKTAIRKGMYTLRDDGARKVMAGDTTFAEILRVTQDDLLDLE
ncbi:MAG: type II secretion system ATPase GspE [Myxococcales bacterium]|nr:type II secretion system ATPase GspE [Myxococcales bacterium]